MRRADLKELQFITAIANVPSIMLHGILCKNLSKVLAPVSIAMQEIQSIRANKTIPGGRLLHEYANLYFHARNPMMFKRCARHKELCVLRIDTAVLDMTDVIIADANAASKYTAFWQSPTGLTKVDRDLVFAEDWRDSDQISRWQKTAAKYAEVLVPRCVPPNLIVGAYVSCEEGRHALAVVGFNLPIILDAHLFFRG